MEPRGESRRRFLEHLRNSPVYAHLALAGGLAKAASPKDAVNIFDLAKVAQANLSEPHWAYLVTGVDDNLTRQANRDGFKLFQIRPRRFVYIDKIDTSLELFGQKLTSPIVLAPAASHRTFHEEGELAVARAARERGHQMILTNFSTFHVAEVANQFQRPLWFQVYPTENWEVARQIIGRGEEAGCPVLVFTADTPIGSNREVTKRAGSRDRDECRLCHAEGTQGYLSRRGTFKGIDYTKVKRTARPITWDFVDKVRRITKMKIVIKGVLTREDAMECVARGMDGIIVSNHGGRQLESGLSTIEALPEVVEAVDGKIPVLIDGGFRRGTDVFKALAIGAKAICIGRPYLWGLGAYGQPGVERILELMQAELVLDMKLAGTTSLDQITPAFVQRRAG